MGRHTTRANPYASRDLPCRYATRAGVTELVAALREAGLLDERAPRGALRLTREGIALSSAIGALFFEHGQTAAATGSTCVARDARMHFPYGRRTPPWAPWRSMRVCISRMGGAPRRGHRGARCAYAFHVYVGRHATYVYMQTAMRHVTAAQVLLGGGGGGVEARCGGGVEALCGDGVRRGEGQSGVGKCSVNGLCSSL